MDIKKIQVHSGQSKEVIDVTDQINAEIKKYGIKSGLCHLFLTHTTAALTTADLDPGTDLDMLEAFDALVPKLKFRHPHDPSHVPDHILSSLIGASVLVPIEKEQLILGTWQRIVLIEFDGPRDREIIISFI